MDYLEYIRDYYHAQSKGFKDLDSLPKAFPKELLQDEEFVEQMIGNGLTKGLLNILPDNLKNDKDFLIILVQADDQIYRTLPKQFQKDPDIALYSLKPDGYGGGYGMEFPIELMLDRDFVLQAAGINGNIICNYFETGLYGSGKYKDYDLAKDRELILTAVSHASHALNYLSNELKDDKEIVLAAVSHYGTNYQYASDRLKDDDEVIEATKKAKKYPVDVYTTAYPNYIPPKLRNDRRIALASVKKNAFAFEKLPNEFRDDKEIALEAVKNNGCVIEFASERLKQDDEVMYEAASSNFNALEYASPDQLRNRDLILRIAKRNGKIFCMDYEMNRYGYPKDREIVLAAVSNYGNALKYASKELQNDKEVVLTAVKNAEWDDCHNDTAFMYASDELKHDREVVETAVKCCPSSFEFIPESFKEDPELKALGENKSSLPDDVPEDDLPF